jgi:hypothetical protein
LRPRHTNKEIEKAICYAEEKRWVYQKAGRSAHAWGRLLCPFNESGGCMMSIWSTPRNTQAHANQIIRNVERCPHDEVSNE